MKSLLTGKEDKGKGSVVCKRGGAFITLSIILHLGCLVSPGLNAFPSPMYID